MEAVEAVERRDIVKSAESANNVKSAESADMVSMSVTWSALSALFTLLLTVVLTLLLVLLVLLALVLVLVLVVALSESASAESALFTALGKSAVKLTMSWVFQLFLPGSEIDSLPGCQFPDDAALQAKWQLELTDLIICGHDEDVTPFLAALQAKWQLGKVNRTSKHHVSPKPLKPSKS